MSDVFFCFLCYLSVIHSRMLMEGLQRFGAIPTYLPVRYQVLNAESAFFLKEANQDIMRNSSLQVRTELFFIQQARNTPSVNASYGPLYVEQPVPAELLGPGLFNNPSSMSPSSTSSPLFSFNWKVQTFIISERIHPSWPKVQVLFYVVGRNWDDYSAVDKLPCVRMFAFHETQEVRGPTPMRRIGSVRLFQPLSELRLDSNFVVMVPSRPIRQRETVSAFLAVSTLSSVEIFTLSLHSNILILLFTTYFRVEAGFQKVLQVDLEVNGLLDPLGSRSVTWQIEYPISRTLSDEIQTLIRLAPHDLGGIVPLAMETEILNTAVLTGKTVAMPVKVVTVGTEGTVTDVTESVECRSTDEDVVKVSERCDYVYVNGKEMRGRVRMMVNFTYSYLSAQLEVSVWMPRLPLQIEMSDPELSQIRSWKVPVDATNQRSGEDDGDEGAKKDRSCGPQYQSTTVHVLTHFEAQPEEWQGQPDFLLGSDWQVDVTELVRDSLRVADERVAKLSEEQVLIGLNTGITKVMSPLSDSLLAERMIRVLDDKVSITELGVQLVSGLSLNLQLSPGSNRAIVATATTQETMHSANLESLVSAWLQFSDGSMTPLDLYNPAHFVLTATSLDDQVVTVKKSTNWRWPVVVAKGEGQGMLVRLEMYGPESCQKTKRRTVLAAGNANVHVKFGRDEETGNSSSDRRYRPNAPYYGGSISDMEAGIMNRGATTIKTSIPGKASGDRLSAGDIPMDFSEFPAQADLPPGRNMEDDLLQTRRGLTDLEIGMYALLGVFCLAILVFLINCVSYALKYRNKQLPLEGQETMAHAHDWVWLGHDTELLESQAGLCLDQEELGGTMDSGLGLEEGSQLLNGLSSQKSVQGQVHRSASDSGCAGRDHKIESINSPTTKRKRVKFTTFSHSKPSNGCPSISPLLIGQNDIKWVCPDIELGDSKELRNYMERLNENATKNIA
uniref:Si:dkey-112m2.1 n=1 Tax=Sinocyclocheilus rhinocerous TaxID=307959 RepID=A0A673JH21_9TELE